MNSRNYRRRDVCQQCGAFLRGFSACSDAKVCGSCYEANVMQRQRDLLKRIAAEAEKDKKT